MQMDMDALTVEKVEMLFNAAPEKDEIQMFLEHPPEDLSCIALPDQFFLEMSSVPQVKARIESIKINYTWKEAYIYTI
jgi:diaphanous 1